MGHPRPERGAELSTGSPPGGELDPLAGRGGSWTDLADPNVLCEGLLGNVWPSPLSGRSSTPTSGRASHRFRGRLGTLSPSGPCSLPPLSTRQFEVVDARRSPIGPCWPVGLLDAVDRYRQAKASRSPGTVLEAKTRVWEEFGEAMEEDYRSAASKRFWQTSVRRLRRGKQYSANTVYSAGGELLTSTGDIVGRWKKYFEDLLNPTDLPSSEEAEAGDSEVDSSITRA
ncbi:hypothetical protein L3Q82_016553 [Scortum barcoo]|uniref:Uncharacterized protein n=1 Tax=Scortum barcoo TaxID=214431 RepID=A0ACB8X7K2_9TELE|nr:hypothetical protein L3Q82_016553 [Scortum barcoo]